MTALLIANWKLVLIGLVLAAVGGYIWHCESVKSSWEEAKAIANRQNAENAKQALRDIKNKERSDENYQRNISRLAADIKRLRNASASNLPSVAPGSPSADRACFDRAEFTEALRRYRDSVARGRAELRELIGEGAKAVEGLDAAKAWAADR